MSLVSTLPPLIMFSITVAVVSMCFLPATYERKSKLLNFYWVGVWLFIGLIAALAGGEQTVRLAGLGTSDFATRLQYEATLAFMIFVVFAWIRLSGVALVASLSRLTRV